jgi:hypothetical protein
LSFHLHPNPRNNMQQSKKNRPFMNSMCVTYNKAIFYDFLLTISGSGCIPVVILVEDLNLWFHRDLLSLIVKWTFQELLTTFPLFAHKWRSKHTHILQYF